MCIIQPLIQSKGKGITTISTIDTQVLLYLDNWHSFLIPPPDSSDEHYTRSGWGWCRCPHCEHYTPSADGGQSGLVRPRVNIGRSVTRVQSSEQSVTHDTCHAGVSPCHNTDQGSPVRLECGIKWQIVTSSDTRRPGACLLTATVSCDCLCRKFGQSIDYFPVVLWIISRIRYTTTHLGWLSGFSQNNFC